MVLVPPYLTEVLINTVSVWKAGSKLVPFTADLFQLAVMEGLVRVVNISFSASAELGCQLRSRLLHGSLASRYESSWEQRARGKGLEEVNTIADSPVTVSHKGTPMTVGPLGRLANNGLAVFHDLDGFVVCKRLKYH